jgi:A/G-specific adenine glycosylase
MIGSTADFVRKLRRWYQQHRRDLPWRLPVSSATGKLNPYHVLVSEAMLQQTQVATVIPYFQRFLQLFPTIESLAQADQQQVLRAWQGLGYYSRARNLQSAAKVVVAEFNGRIPSTVEELLTLPGIGRYTAGAVSSIAFENKSPILDGNVARVLCRIDAVREDPKIPATREKLWARAEEILPRKNIGDFNSALMELGALVCTPRSPQCLICPARSSCSANAAGLQDKIPPAKPSKKSPLYTRWTFCIRDGDRYLVQQRPAKGRWAGMWQFFTVESQQLPPSSDLLQSQFSLRVTEPILIGTVEHALTHRRYRFDVFACECRHPANGEWATLAELHQRPMSRPQLKIREMIP